MYIKNKKSEDLQTKNKERKRKRKTNSLFIFFNQATSLPKNDPSVSALEMGANAMGEELLGLWPRGQRLNGVTQTVIWRIGDFVCPGDTTPMLPASVCATVAASTLAVSVHEGGIYDSRQ